MPLFFRHRFTQFRRPRNPLLRVALGLLGAGVLMVLLVFGLFAGIAMLAFTAVRRLLGLGPLFAPASVAAARRDDGVLEGEYDVVRKPHDSLYSR